MADPAPTDGDAGPDRSSRERHSLRLRHASALARLMDERRDLRGVHALADLVDDSLRWST